MRFLLPISALALTATACKVEDAPEDLETLVVYGFEHMGDEDDRPIVEVAAGLPPLADAQQEALEEGFRVGNLTAVHLEAAGVEAAEVTDIIGALGRVNYSHDLDSVVDALTLTEKVGNFEQYIEYDVLEQTDRDCFLAHECPTLFQEVHELAEAGILGEAERTFTIEHRWVQTEAGDIAMAMRTVSPDPVEFNTSLANVFQQYAFVLIYEQDGAAVRAETFWVDAEVIGLNVPDNFAVSQAVNSMGTAAERVDLYIDGGEAE